MAITIKTKHVLLTCLIAVVIIFFLGWGLGRKNKDNGSTPLIDSLNKKVEYLVLELNNKNLYVAKVNQEILTQKEAIAQGEIERAELKALNIKRVSEITRLRGQIKILADSIANNGNVIIVRDCDSLTADTTKAIKLPFKFNKVDKFYQLYGGFDTNGRMDATIAVPMEVSVITGWDKKAREYKAAVVTSNPYVIFNGVSSVKVWASKPKKYGIGLQSGYGVMLGDPIRSGFYFGVGLSYNFIRF